VYFLPYTHCKGIYMPKFANPVSYHGRKANSDHSGQARFATDAEAITGTATDLIINPANLTAAVDDVLPDATEVIKGKARLSTAAEATAGVDDATIMTPAKVALIAIAGAPDASETVKGIIEIATTAEAVAVTDDARAVTPAKVADIFAAPPAMGSGTPAAGSFSTLAATGAIDFDAGGSFESGGAAIDIGADASADAINLGTGAAARVITIGNVTGASQVVLNSGTAGVAINTTGAGDVVVTSADTVLIDAAGVLELNSSAGVIGIGNDAVAQNINIGTGAAARTITLGNSTGATSLVLDCGTGALNIGTNAIAHTVSIGNTTGATAIAMSVGSGNFSLDGVAASTYTVGASTTTGTISIGGTAQTGTITLGDSSGVNIVEIGAGEGATTVNIAGGATAAKAVNIGTGAVANVITVGSASAGAVAVDTAAGISLDSATASNFTVTGAADLTLASSAGSVIINGEEAVADAIQIQSAAGGIDADAALQINIASSQNAADAIRMNASAGGIDIDAAGAAGEDINITNTAGSVVLSAGESANDALVLTATAGGIDILASGAAAGEDIDIVATGSSVNIQSTESVASAIVINASDAAGGIQMTAGTGDITVTGSFKEVNSEFAYSTGTDLQVQQSPIMQSNLTTGAAPSGANGDVNLMYLQDGCIMEQFIIGTQTIIAPRMSANGLAIELDNTNAEGVEYNFGARNNAKHAYTIGTSAAFFVEATFTVADISGCAPLVVGFRKVEANNAVVANYTDYFAAGLNSATSATNVVLMDELNSGGQTLTDSTDAWTGGDGGTTTIRVLVSASGVCTYTIDGGAPSATNAMTFDNADVVMPFIAFLNGADVAGEVALSTFKCGFQA
jgi:hypothetical protein